jgi:hypothetical protein
MSGEHEREFLEGQRYEDKFPDRAEQREAVARTLHRRGVEWNTALLVADEAIVAYEEALPQVPVAEVEQMLRETDRYFAGDHVNAGVVVGDMRKRLRDLSPPSSPTGRGSE